MTDALLVFTTCPDEASAERIAETLVAESLAACVSRLAPVVSVYRWQGRIERAVEVPLMIKCTAGRYPAVEAAIRAQHPHEVPEIVAVAVSAGYGPYLRWVAAETQAARLA